MSSGVNQDSGHPLHHYLVDEQEWYLSKMKGIMGEFKYFMDAEEIFGQEDRDWCMAIVRNKIPTGWNIKSTLNLDQWLQQFL